jgi:DNA invertase Pin-like site-specific DNA recombinase
VIYGYARVSTDGQSVDAQVKQLRAAGAEKIFRETATGAKADRVQLCRALAQLANGDVLMVTRLDRLARSQRDLLNMLAGIGDKGAGFLSLGDPWADTTTAHGRSILAVLGGLAEFERELIRVRTSEGRERAKARGVHMGRKPKLTALVMRDKNGHAVFHAIRFQAALRRLDHFRAVGRLPDAPCCRWRGLATARENELCARLLRGCRHARKLLGA